MKNKLTTVTLKHTDKPNPGKTNLKKIKAMGEAEVEARARDDKNNLPLTHAQLAYFKPVHGVKEIDVKALREKLGISQEQFASYFGVSVRTLQDWEQHRHEPNTTARNFLLVVAKEPQAVQRALG